LLKRSIKLVILRFKPYTSNIELVQLLYVSIKARLGIVITDEF